MRGWFPGGAQDMTRPQLLEQYYYKALGLVLQQTILPRYPFIVGYR